MKKLITLLLALVMVMSLSVTAFADPIEMGPDGGSSAKDVYVKIVEGGTANKVYSIVVEWQLTDGVMQKAATYTWDPTELKYTAGQTGGWAMTTNPEMTISIENRSNAKIAYKLHDMYSALTQHIPVTEGAVWVKNGSDYRYDYKGYEVETEMASAAPADYSTEAQTSAPKDTINIKFTSFSNLSDVLRGGYLSADETGRVKVGTITITIIPKEVTRPQK